MGRGAGGTTVAELAEAVETLQDDIAVEVHLIHKALNRLVGKVTRERVRLVELQKEAARERDVLRQRCAELNMPGPGGDAPAPLLAPTIVEYYRRTPGIVDAVPGVMGADDADDAGSPPSVGRWHAAPAAAASPPRAPPAASAPPSRPVSAGPRGRSPAPPGVGGPVRAPPTPKLEAAWMEQRAQEALRDPSCEPLEGRHNFWTIVCRLLRERSGAYELMVLDPDTRHVLYKHAMEAGFSPVAEAACDGGPSARPTLSVRTFPAPARGDFPFTGAEGAGAAGVRHSEVVRRRRGFVHHAGTAYGAREWATPHPARARVTCSSARGGCECADLVKKEIGYFSTLNKRDQWVTVDLGYPALVPTHYSLASAHPMYGGYYPRNWRFEGSRDAEHWHLLSLHEDDESLTRHTPYGLWALHAPPEIFRFPMRYFRITATGPNSFGSGELQVSALELYGRAVYMSLTGPGARAPAAAQQRGRVGPTALPPMPAQPVEQKAPKKGRKGSKSKGRK